MREAALAWLAKNADMKKHSFALPASSMLQNKFNRLTESAAAAATSHSALNSAPRARNHRFLQCSFRVDMLACAYSALKNGLLTFTLVLFVDWIVTVSLGLL